jgi:preprotein translocase subunit SecE
MCAWRLFALSDTVSHLWVVSGDTREETDDVLLPNKQMVRIRDIQILLIVIKTLLISYVADLLLGDHGAE